MSADTPRKLARDALIAMTFCILGGLACIVIFATTGHPAALIAGIFTLALAFPNLAIFRRWSA
jgi:hypothetical protein